MSSSLLKSVLLASTGVLAATTVHATEASATSSADAASEPSTLVVTAQRRATALQKTPIAISAFSANTLADRNISNTRDLAGEVPNLFVARTSISHTTQTFSLRGVGESDPIQEPVLAIYVDDVYVPRQIGSMSEFVDLERVELLRGPQGTLYGRNSSAGALRLITRNPDQNFRESFELGYGTFGDKQVKGLISGPLSKDWAGSLSYIHRDREGVTHDPTLGHDVNRINLDNVRGKLRYTGINNLDALLTVNLIRDRSDTRSYIPANPAAGFDRHTSYSEVPPTQHLDSGSVSLRLNYTLTPSLSLRSISAAGGFDLNPVNYDNDGEATLIQKNLIHYNDQFASQELQLNGDFGKLTFTSGIFYLYERFYVQRDGFSRTGALLTSPLSSLRAHNTTQTNAAAIFGEATYQFNPVWSVTAGLRGTKETKDFVFDNKVLDVNGNVVSQSIKGEAKKSWTGWTPKLSVNAQWTPNVLQYLSYSRGFKSGGFDNRATRLDLAELPFNPETVSSYETGLKAGLIGGKLRSNLAVFYNDYQDLQVSFYDPAYVGSRRGNAGKAHTEGLELENNFRVNDRLSLNANIGLLNAVYDEYKGAGGNGVNADGNPIVNSPNHTYSLGGVYDIPLGARGTLSVSVNGQYQSHFYTSALHRAQDEVPGQSFVDAGITWQTPNPDLKIVLTGKNLTDSKKPVGVTYTPSTNVYYYNFADPTTFLLSVKFAR